VHGRADTDRDHPSPDRHNVSLSALFFGLVIAPLPWSVQSVAGYVITTRACFPADVPRTGPLGSGVEGLLLVLNLAAIAAQVAGLAIASRSWLATRREYRGSAAHLLEIGEGRSRFLALCGMIVSAGFLVGTLFTTAALLVTPECR
jgi:hypothetical protein